MRPTTRRVLVVGANGFLGGHVLRRLDGADGVTAIPAVRQWHGAPRNRPTIRLDLLQADATIARSAVAALRPDVVVNCAGATTGPADVLWSANVVLVHRLIDAAAATGAHLVHIGSSTEYGPTPWGTSVAESAPCHPVDAYGASKVEGTAAVLEAAATGAVRGTVLRVFNPVGPAAPDTTLAGRTAQLLRRAMRSGAPAVELRSLASWRDFLDVRDVADAVLAAVRRPTTGPRVCNVGSGRAMTARDLVHQLVAITGFPGDVIEQPPAAGHRSAAIAWQQADTLEARRHLGWEARRTVTGALQSLWQSVAGPAAELAW